MTLSEITKKNIELEKTYVQDLIQNWISSLSNNCLIVSVKEFVNLRVNRAFASNHSFWLARVRLPDWHDSESCLFHSDFMETSSRSFCNRITRTHEHSALSFSVISITILADSNISIFPPTGSPRIFDFPVPHSLFVIISITNQ